VIIYRAGAVESVLGFEPEELEGENPETLTAGESNGVPG
jgi:hypothetical protein